MDRKSDEGTAPGESREEIEKEAATSRKALDEVPPPGPDPLHEGP